MTTIRLIFFIPMLITAIGVAIYTIISIFYFIPSGLEGKSRKEAYTSIPLKLRRFGNICIVTFIFLFLLSNLIELLARWFH
jgi:hypothetical protein